MAAESTSAPAWPAFQAARRRRGELLRAIQRFEAAVAAPASEPGWRDRVHRRLAAVAEQLAEHVVVTEGPDGLYAELLEHAPRLDRPVAGLVAEHGALQRRVDALARWLGAPVPEEVERIRQRAGELLVALSRHRQRGADLVYEAYATDIGGET
jgi:hypothetical protein